MREISSEWLVDIEDNLPHNSYIYLWNIISESIKLKKINYLSLLYDISKGNGFFFNEYLGFALDNDYEDKNEFKQVEVYCGSSDSPSQKLSVEEFIKIIDFFSEKYTQKKPEDKKTVVQLLDNIREHFFNITKS